MNKVGKQAVVIGGSMAGLMAARALSPYFESVVMVERDRHPETSDPRKAVPQGYHAHALLKSGESALESLFPNLANELLRCGAHRIDFSNDLRWFHGGKWKLRYASGFEVMVQTRPLLEEIVRKRIEARGNIRAYYGYEVAQIKTSADNSKVVGAVICDMETRSGKFELNVDLVVDASGRGSKTPDWLHALGYAAPRETCLKIDLTYSSRLYKAPENRNPDWKLMVMNPQGPEVLRAGYIFPVENDQWLVTLAGYSGDATPTSNESFVDYARRLAQPDIYEALQNLIPLSDVKVYRIPQTVRRHYESCRMPQGLLVMGDAFCGFDPVFGQGMSVAAQQAVALQDLLSRGGVNFGSLGKRFHTKAARIVDNPWMLTSSEDFRYPGTVGQKSWIIPILHWYSQHIFELSSTDRQVFEAFRQVMHLLEGAEALFKPAIVLKVLRHALTTNPGKSGIRLQNTVETREI